MIYILDGYNVIYAIPEFERKLDVNLEAARNALVAFCADAQARRGDVDKIYVVFDGAGQTGDSVDRTVPGVTVIFTKRSEEADDRILRLIKDDAGRRTFTVVSRDNYVYNNAKAHRVTVIPPQAFLDKTRVKPGRRTTASGVGEPGSPKTDGLSARDARAITDAYRRYLDGHHQPEQDDET